MDFLHGMASDSLRLGTLQKEMHDAHDDDELKYELKGKRIWRVGGVGMWAYTGSENEDEVKKKVWRDWGEKHGKDDWIKAARARTDFYRSGGLRSRGAYHEILTADRFSWRQAFDYVEACRARRSLTR